MNFLFNPDRYGYLNVAGIEILANDQPDLIIPWWHYLVPLPGFAYETIRRKKNKRFPIFASILSGAAYYATYKAIKHKINSNDAYDLHESSTFIRVKKSSYKEAIEERDQSLIYAGAGFGWRGHAPLRWCRCQTPRHRKHRASLCGCHRKRSSSQAGCIRFQDQ